jgi:hypothetical protein
MRTRLLTGSSILVASVLVAICSGSASAGDGFRLAGHSGMRGGAGIGPGLGRPGFGRPGLGHRVHGFGHVLGRGWAGRGWRGGAVYLDDDYGYGNGIGYGPTTIVIDRSVATRSASPYSVPSVTDVPSVAGIRQPPSAESAFYVVNEPHASQASMRRVSGPRIVERIADAEGGWASQRSEESFGARIIHLTVPVGAGR